MSPSLVRFGTLALSGLTAVAIGHAAARLTWSLSGETGVTLPDIAASVERAQPPALDLTPILLLAPFGSAVVESAPEAVAEETSLGLILRGIVTAAPSGKSVAVIATGDGQAKLYAVGDVIEGNATLIEVLPDRAMLQVGDRVESLSYPKLSSAGSFADLSAEPNEGEDVAAVATDAEPNEVEDTPIRPGTTGSIEPLPMIEDLRARIMDNPQAFMDSVGISAAEGGYAIAPNASASLLKTGLRPGDLIAKVNGQPVGTIEQDRQLLDDVIASGNVRVEVIRDGRNVVMSFPLQ